MRGVQQLNTFQITIQRKRDQAWLVVAEHLRPGSHLPRRVEGTFVCDQATLFSQVQPRDYGTVLGQALFKDKVRDAFVQAQAESQDDLHVLLYVKADDLKGLRWERLCAELDLGWDLLAFDHRTPFALHLPSPARREFPPFGQRDLRALVVAASPAGLKKVRLEPFDAEAAAERVQAALGEIPCDLLAPPVDRRTGGRPESVRPGDAGGAAGGMICREVEHDTDCTRIQDGEA